MLFPEFSEGGGQKSGPPEWPWHPDAWPAVQGMAHWEWIIPAAAVFYSREWQRMLQSDDEGVLGPSNAIWWPLVHDDDLEPFMEAAREIAEGRSEQYRTLLRIQRADGAWLWLLSVGRVTEYQGGRPCRVTGTITDVSALRSDVKFLHGSQAPDQENALLANSPDLIVRMDRQLGPLFNNPKIARYFTRSAGVEPSAAGEAVFGMPPGQLQFLRENVQRVFDTGLSAREVVSFPTAYGHDVTGEYSFWPEFDQKGAVLSVLTQFRDLTERILAERRARLNEMRLEALYRLTQMDSAPREEVLDFVMESLIHLTGSKAGFLFFPSETGGGGHVVWSRNLQSHVEQGNLPRVAPPAGLLDLLSDGGSAVRRRLANGNGLFPLYRSLDGGLNIMKYISAPVFDRERLVCMAAVFNKEPLYYESDLQQLEAFVSSSWHILRRHGFVRQLRMAKESAENANRVKDSFLANVSHELRTPLNGMLGMLQLLEETTLSPRQREYVSTADASGRSLLRIISDILDFSRMEADKFELRNEIMDPGDIVRSSVKLFQQEAAGKGLEFSLNLDPDLPALVRGDDARVRQVIFNLVGNALKFTEKGAIAVNCSPLPSEDPGQVRVRFSVRDTGIGIPRGQRDMIFEPFTQLDNSTAKKYAGTGLGLTIVKRIIDLMGGDIEIDSEENAGTTVHCVLCFTSPGALPETPGAKAEERAPAMDILVAEDDPTSRFALGAFLQLAGHRTVCVDNGTRALEALQLHPFHCLFTDIQMPGMDGLELIRRIRGRDIADFSPTEETRAIVRAVIPDAGAKPVRVDPAILAVSVSAHVMAGDRDRFLSQGMDFYLSKPVLRTELHAVLALIAERLAWG